MFCCFQNSQEIQYTPTHSFGPKTELQLAAEALHRKARNTADFFDKADNVSSPEILDLDPREGYVRLGSTKAPGLLGENFLDIRGLMNADGELQAVSVTSTASSILTISERGRRVTLQLIIGGKSFTETLIYEQDGSRRFQRACA